jgi:hypothetical protein
VLSPYLSPAGSARVASVRSIVAEKRSLPFAVYPNPAQGLATVTFTARESGTLEMEVFDLQGRPHQQLLHQQVQAGSIHQYPLDTSTLPSGMYLLRLVNGKSVQNLKLFVIH